MELTRFVNQLQGQLAAGADGLGDDARALAERLAPMLDSATRLTLLEALSEAASEITAELAPGSVDVRLRGTDPQFVVLVPPAAEPAATVAPASAPAEPAESEGDESATSRTTLRIPENLKLRAEAAAVREGVSLNTWLVRAISAAVESGTAVAPAPQQPRSTGNRYTGWVR
jgi:hypothetical protein